MVTSETWGRRDLFRNERWACLLIDTLYHYRGSAYLLHEFVIMPDHFHILLTPMTSLEKAVQFIKGGFSYRAKKELGSNMEIWQKGFSEHRIRDASDYQIHVSYIRQNPVRKRLCERAEEFPCSSAHGGFELDAAPQGLKPGSSEVRLVGAPEGAPFQNDGPCGAAKAAPFQNGGLYGAPEGAPLQSNSGNRTFELPPLQGRPVRSEREAPSVKRNKIA
jgi:putative transposase